MVTPVAVDMVVEDLNMLLSDLAINCLDAGQTEFTEMGIRSGGYQDISFTKSCNIVIEQTWVLERALASLGKDHGQETMSDLRGAGIIDVAISRGMPYLAQRDDLTTARVEALSFMCSELQALCIDAHRARQPQQQRNNHGGEIPVVPPRTRALAAINTLQGMLELPPSSSGVDESMAAIATTASALQLPSGPQGPGDMLLLQGVDLNALQQQKAERVHAAIVADFSLRRRMLLRRCDVTVQSFLRQAKGKGEGRDGTPSSLPPPLEAKRAAMSEEPRRITIEDALAAPRKIAWRHASKMTANSTAATATKMVVLGNVPHRGGRVTEARAASMPAWTERKDLDSRGRGGGRGGWGGSGSVYIPGGSRGGYGGGGRGGRGQGSRGHGYRGNKMGRGGGRG